MFRLFERLTEPFPQVSPSLEEKGLITFYRQYSQGYTGVLLALGSLTAAIAIIELILFGFIGELVDWLGHRDPATLWREESSTLISMSILVLVALPIAVVLHSMLFHQSITVNFSMAVRWMAHRRLLDQSYSFYQDEFPGRLAAKVMQTSEAFRESLVKLMESLLYTVIYVGGMLYLMASADWRLSIPLCIWAICYLLLMVRGLPNLKARAQEQADAHSVMTGRLADSYTHFSAVKLFSHAGRESDYAKEGMNQFLNAVYPLMRVVTSLNVSVWLLNAGLIFATVALALWLWSQNSVTTGAIAVAMALTLRLKNLSQFIMWEVAALFRNIGAVQDGFKTLARPRQVQDHSDAETLKIGQGEVRFNQISFAYQPEKPVFRNLNLTVKAGEKIGLVGASGAGKSSLIHLLLRFYDPDQGDICIDDQNIRQMTQDSVRGAIGVVSQDTALLHRSVRENLLYGRPEATEDEMIEACKQAQIHDVIMDLVDAEGRTGYDAFVGERGVKLSGGQRQRISIARVLIKDAPILVLDEATSALDSESEAAIQEQLETLMQGKTVIAIAHRLSTLSAMDRLIVLDRGEIKEQGSHGQLIAAEGLYNRLWKRQTGNSI